MTRGAGGSDAPQQRPFVGPLGLPRIGNQYLVDPRFGEGQPAMLIAGDDEEAERTVGDALADFGWSDVVDIGGIEGARELEAICIAWVKIGGARGAWDHGFKLLVG